MKNKIFKIIEESSEWRLNAEDFTPIEKNNQFILQYSYESEYNFSVELSTNTHVTVKYSPSSFYKNSGSIEIQNIDLLINIKKWVHYLVEEIFDTPIARQVTQNSRDIHAQKKILEKFFNERTEFDTYFTKEEAAEYKTKLEQILFEMSQKVEKVNNATQDYDEEIARLQKEVEALKTQLDILTKRKWFSSLTTKTIIWCRRNPQVAKQMASSAKNFPPEEIKSAIPDYNSSLPIPKKRKKLQCKLVKVTYHNFNNSLE
ncbi:hypothetical protein V1503_06140 [Bacillus sp. SCS-151]|uniref:hypothetical protein n=1 Tax=Nanhaiella sioensis TaxID=3115293 RepID=UPI00397A78A8